MSFTLNALTTLTTLANQEVGHGAGETWVDEYLSLLQDPAHILFELTFSIIFDLVIVYLGYTLLIKRVIIPRLRREIHKELDEEHHISHHNHVEGDSDEACAKEPS